MKHIIPSGPMASYLVGYSSLPHSAQTRGNTPRTEKLPEATLNGGDELRSIYYQAVLSFLCSLFAAVFPAQCNTEETHLVPTCSS